MRWTVLLLVSTISIAKGRPQNQENGNPSVDVYPKVTLLPYYGGAKGQSLQVTDLGNGDVTMTVVKSIPEQLQQTREESPEDITELNNIDSSQEYSFNLSEKLKVLQAAAMRIVELEELSKKNGQLSEEQKEAYKKNMDILNETASKLAVIQEETDPIGIENREGLSAWFERTKSNKKTKKKDEEDRKKKEDERKRKEEADKKKRKEEEERKRKEEEEKRKEEEEKKRKEEEERKKGEKEEEQEEKEIGGDDESVAVNLPPEDASVAEVKPVGLAIAGEGGVAASKPIGTAVVGPGGLAIARPIATAIAGVPPDEALIPLYGGIAGNKPSKSKDKTAHGSSNYYISKLLKKYHESDLS